MKMTDEELQAKFLYDNGTLRNKFAIKNADELSLIEYRGAAEREVALLQQQPKIKSFEDLQTINKFLFGWLYDWAGELRNYYISKAGFDFLEYGRFDNAIKYINDEIVRLNKKKQPTIEDYAALLNDLNYIHPFREGNGRSTRIWLDIIMKRELNKVIDWSVVDKEDYLLAMERSPIKDIEIKYILKQALTEKINDRKVYMKGIDHSYYYEGYVVYKAEEL